MNASEIELQLNSKKTKIMSFAQTNPRVNIYTTLNAQITIVDNFKYLGSWMNSSLKDFEFRTCLESGIYSNTIRSNIFSFH